MKTIYTLDTPNNVTNKYNTMLFLPVCFLILFFCPRQSHATTSQSFWIYNIDLKAAYTDNNHVVVEWEVIENEEPQYYALEKSTDGNTYNEVYRINAKNTDQPDEPVSYQGIDGYMSQGLSYYRVSRVDANGNKIYSYSIAFRNETENFTHFASIDVYPNPFADHCCVKLTCKEDSRVNLVIAGSKGRIYYSMDYNCNQGENVIHLDLRDKMLEGMCFIRVVNAKSGDCIFERIVKNDR